MGREMNRRLFLKGGALAVAAMTTGPAAAGKSASDSNPFLGTQGEPLKVGFPCLQAPGETTMGVSWCVSGLSRGEVEVADNPSFRNARLVKSGGYGLVPIDVVAQQVRIEGLTPGRRYWYRTITTPFTDYKNIYAAKLGEPIVSEIHTFTTAGADARASFCVINDTHAQWKAFEMVVAKAKSLSPAAIVWNGDATNTTQDKKTAAEIFLDPPIATKDWSSDIPVFFESGNHDFRGSWIAKKEEVVLARHPAERRGDQWDLKWNFAVRLGDVAMVGMDTGEDKPDGHPKWFGLANFSPYRRAQAKWLEEALARPDIADAKFKVAFCHIPLFAAKDHPDYPHDGVKIDPNDYAYWSRECHDLWSPILAKAGVKLVIAAHRHRFRYDAPTADRPWAQILGGGPELGISRGKPDGSRFPTVIEGTVEDGKLVVKVHDVLHGQVVGRYDIAAAV